MTKSFKEWPLTGRQTCLITTADPPNPPTPPRPFMGFRAPQPPTGVQQNTDHIASSSPCIPLLHRPLWRPRPIQGTPVPAVHFWVEDKGGVHQDLMGGGACLAIITTLSPKTSPSTLPTLTRSFTAATSSSKPLPPAKQNYNIGKQKVLAVKSVLEEWRRWLEEARELFIIWTNHKNLEYIQISHQTYCSSPDSTSTSGIIPGPPTPSAMPCSARSSLIHPFLHLPGLRAILSLSKLF